MTDAVKLLHLHTYFIFPFSIDEHTVVQNHPEIWSDPPHRIDGLDRWIAAPPHSSLAIHYAAVALVAILAFGALAFGFYVVAANWSDYRDVLVPPPWKPRKAPASRSLKNAPWSQGGGEE